MYLLVLHAFAPIPPCSVVVRPNTPLCFCGCALLFYYKCSTTSLGRHHALLTLPDFWCFAKLLPYFSDFNNFQHASCPKGYKGSCDCARYSCSRPQQITLMSSPKILDFLARIQHQALDNSPLLLHYNSQAQDLRAWFWWVTFLLRMVLCWRIMDVDLHCQGPSLMGSASHRKISFCIAHPIILCFHPVFVLRTKHRSLIRRLKCS